MHLLVRPRAAADRFHRNGFDDEILALVDEAETGAVGRLEMSAHSAQKHGRRFLRGWIDGHFERRIRAGVAHVSPHVDGHFAGMHALSDDLRAADAPEPVGFAAQIGERGLAERLLERLLARGADIGEAHAIGREQRRERMDEHRLHRQRIRHEARMLAARAAERVERVLRDVVAARDGDLLDRLRHVGDRDLHEAIGHLLGRAASPVAALTSAARSAKAARTLSTSSSSSCPGPKILREDAAGSLPSITLASVTASGPPRR